MLEDLIRRGDSHVLDDWAAEVSFDITQSPVRSNRHAATMVDAPKPLPAVKKQLIVFDFDWSLADQDSDRWVHEALCPRLRRKMKALKPTMQFTDLCAMLLRELHDVEGKGEEDVKAAMRLMPFVSLVVAPGAHV